MVETARVTDLSRQPIPKYKFANDPAFDQVVNDIIKEVPLEVSDAMFHPSSFGSWCRRREVFRILKQHLQIAVPRSKHPPSMRKIFEIGTAVHNHFRDTLLSSMLRGDWKCKTCGVVATTETGECPIECWNCGNRRYHAIWDQFKYVEPTIANAELRVGGSCDGKIFYRLKLRVLELKTMREQEWLHIDSPKAGHVYQALIYAKELGLDSILIVYVNKTTAAMKAYVVPVSPALIEWISNELLSTIAVVERYLPLIKTKDDLLKIAVDAEFTNLNPIVCETKTISKAKSCHSCKECFQGK